MRRWWIPLVAGLAGIAGGLLYGWVINPVKFVDTTPASLRADYCTDYVLMVAESYQANQDAAMAGRRLAILGSESPASLAATALDTAQKADYSGEDIALIQELVRAMQVYQPVTPAAAGTP